MKCGMWTTDPLPTQIQFNRANANHTPFLEGGFRTTDPLPEDKPDDVLLKAVFGLPTHFRS